ncbi:MAG: hypothetical protein FWF25_01290 [Propionibacteriaceae bacterium]|nr:hypothetical protein [Propionibacteriaceae bacterium]
MKQPEALWATNRETGRARAGPVVTLEATKPVEAPAPTVARPVLAEAPVGALPAGLPAPVAQPPILVGALVEALAEVRPAVATEALPAVATAQTQNQNQMRQRA